MASRSASRKLDMPGICTNRVYGMIADTRTPWKFSANGTYSWLTPIHSTGPRESAAAASHSSASSHALPPPPARDQSG